jgi:hypothetical protein
MQAFIGKAADKYTVQPADTIYGKRFSSGTRLMPQGLQAGQVSGGRAALSSFVVAVRSNLSGGYMQRLNHVQWLIIESDNSMRADVLDRQHSAGRPVG